MERVLAASTLQAHMEDIPTRCLESMLLDVVPTLERSGIVLLVDGTGLSTRLYGRWRSVRRASKRVKRKYVKVHLVVDLGRKRVSSDPILDRDASGRRNECVKDWEGSNTLRDLEVFDEGHDQRRAGRQV